MYKRSAIVIFLLLLPWVPKVAGAFTISCINKPFENKLQSLLTPVGIIGRPDRQTEAEVAIEKGKRVTEVQNRYAATGTLKCNGAELSANLVLVDDLIVTSAHAFTNADTCKKVSDFSSCKFTVKIGDKEQSSELLKIISTGLKCPAKDSKPSDDWAVIRLKSKIKNVTPYAVEGSPTVKENQKVTSVAAINLDMYRGKQLLPQETKSIGSCYTHKVYYSKGEAALVSSDCDGTQGESGGAILDDDDFENPPVLLGIHQSMGETEEQVLAQIRKKKEAKQGDFVEKEWANNHVVLKGKVLTEILTAAQK